MYIYIYTKARVRGARRGGGGEKDPVARGGIIRVCGPGTRWPDGLHTVQPVAEMIAGSRMRALCVCK